MDLAVLRVKTAGKHLDRSAVRRLGQAARRRLGAGDRQSVRPRRHGDRRHHFRPAAGYQRRALRRFHPDRRLDQSRQFRRPDVQHEWRGHRHQHGDLLAVGRQRRHRLRHPVQPRQAGDRAADSVRPHASAAGSACAFKPSPTSWPTAYRQGRAAWRVGRRRHARRAGGESRPQARRYHHRLQWSQCHRKCTSCRASSQRRRSAAM